MNAQKTVVQLRSSFFGDSERLFASSGALRASLFRYSTGVDAVRLENGAGSLVLLPFQGQQIWTAEFGGRELTMKSMFEEPVPTRDYLQTYGGFLLHCGATAMGVPGEGDTHPVHGELPNAPYRSAYVEFGEDERGEYVALGGSYKHTVAFSTNYEARPLAKLYSGESSCHVSIEVENLKRTPMELMYMAHCNFRPIDNGHIFYSAECTPEHVRVRRSIPSHVTPGPGYREYIEQLGDQPEQHHVLAPELTFDPEIVFSIDYLADEDGWAHSMQVHPDGNADFIRHRPEQLDVGVRWICRTPDQDALGIILPATAEPEGYTAEKAKGNVKELAGGDTFYCEYEAGMLSPVEATELAAHIEQIVNG